jgi:DNA polymerase-3 subunit chi
VIVARLELHQLSTEKRAGELAGLLERLHALRKRIVVWVADEGRRQILDDYLWTFRKLAFVPHAVWSPSLGEVDDPIVLVGEPANPNGASVLVVGDDPPPAVWASKFEEIHDLIAPGEDGKERMEFWKGVQEEFEVAEKGEM